jgi:hypothetical protein
MNLRRKDPMWKSHLLLAALACAFRLARASARVPIGVSLVMLPGLSALAQPSFSKAGSGTFNAVNTPLLLNDAVGKFQTQGNVLCQAS